MIDTERYGKHVCIIRYPVLRVSYRSYDAMGAHRYHYYI
jgi:hypothetical protein